MWVGGETAVHNNVTFEANTAGVWGGAVRLPFNSSSQRTADDLSLTMEDDGVLSLNHPES